MNGLTLSKEEFQSLSTNKKLDCLFENQVKTIELISGYKTATKVNNWMMGISFAGLAGIFGLLIKHITGG